MQNLNFRKLMQVISILISLAYQTLSNEENKYLYDRLGREKMNDPNIQNQVNVHELKGPSI